MKLDINKQPERFSHIERAKEYDSMIHQEFGWGAPNSEKLFGCHDYSGISQPAFVEGFMAALAFCSGAISGGKFRDMSKWALPGVDTMTMNKFAQSCMERQTLWEKNPDPDEPRRGEPV